MSEAEDVLRNYCKAMENGAAGALEQLAQDVVFHVPCMQPPAPKILTGFPTVEAAFNHVFTHFFKEFRWVKLEVFAGADPALAFAVASSRIVLMSGKIYENDYSFFSRVKDGKIIEQYEFFDSARASAAFAG